MDGSEKVSRIERLKLGNIASANYYKPVTERNNVFCRLKRNTAVLSRINNSEDIREYISESQDINVDSRLNLVDDKKSIQSIKESPRYSFRNQSS